MKGFKEQQRRLNFSRCAEIINKLNVFWTAVLLLITIGVLIFQYADYHHHRHHDHHHKPIPTPPIPNPYEGGNPDSYQGSHKEWEGLPGFEGPFATSKECELRTHANNASRQIYATMLLTDDYLITVSKLHCSLKRVGATRPLVVFYNNISTSTLDTLHSYGLQTRPLNLISYPNNFAKRFSTNWSKLKFWEMVEYDRIIYLDSDMIVLQNVDSLFSLNTPFAVPPDNERSACGGPMGFNQAGLLVLVPCVETYKQMIELVEANSTLQFRNSDAEQGFLNYYFQYTRMLLPATYNVLPHRSWHTPLRDQAKIIHYTAVKPFAPKGWPALKKHESYHEPWLNCTDY